MEGSGTSAGAMDEYDVRWMANGQIVLASPCCEPRCRFGVMEKINTATSSNCISSQMLGSSRAWGEIDQQQSAKVVCGGLWQDCDELQSRKGTQAQISILEQHSGVPSQTGLC